MAATWQPLNYRVLKHSWKLDKQAKPRTLEIVSPWEHLNVAQLSECALVNVRVQVGMSSAQENHVTRACVSDSPLLGLPLTMEALGRSAHMLGGSSSHW